MRVWKQEDGCGRRGEIPVSKVGHLMEVGVSCQMVCKGTDGLASEGAHTT